jgi:hypothetical protein
MWLGNFENLMLTHTAIEALVGTNSLSLALSLSLSLSLCLSLLLSVSLSFITLSSALAFAKTKGQVLERIPDDKLSKLPDNVPRPRGPSDFFTLADGGKKFYVVVADGKPYVTIVPF